MKYTLLNNSFLWDKLLGNPDYLNDFNLMTTERIRYAAAYIRGVNPYILNIGSGQGYFEKYIEKLHNGGRIISTDISITGLNKIKSDIATFTPLQAGLPHLPFRSQVFRYIVCMEVLEHIHKNLVNKVYQEFYRLLKDEGRVIISVPIYERATLINHPVGHYRKYTSDIFENELVLNGFRIIEGKFLYAFNNMYKLKSALAALTKLRKPNLMIVLCEKS